MPKPKAGQSVCKHNNPEPMFCKHCREEALPKMPREKEVVAQEYLKQHGGLTPTIATFRDGWEAALEEAALEMEYNIDGSDVHDPKLNRFLRLAADRLRELK